MRSLKLGFLLVVLAVSNLAGHRMKQPAGCQCTEEDLEKTVRVFSRGVSLAPGESGPLSFTSATETGDALSHWTLVSTPSLIKSGVSAPPEIASTMFLNVIVKPAAELSKHLEFLSDRPGLQGDVCVEATPVLEVYREGNGCGSVRVDTPEIDVYPLGRNAATVQVSNASSGGWSLIYKLGSAKDVEKYVAVREGPVVPTSDGVRTTFAVDVSRSAPPNYTGIYCDFAFSVTVLATNGDVTLEGANGFHVPVNCPK